jgi:hypothetical protein
MIIPSAGCSKTPASESGRYNLVDMGGGYFWGLAQTMS